MGQFVGTIDLQIIPGQANKWLVPFPFKYISDNGDEINVEEGLITDLASTPRIVWSIYPPWGLYVGAAIVHDQLYTDLGKVIYDINGVAVQKDYTRHQCDGILLEAMKAENVSLVTRDIIYSQVVMWGWWAWKEHQNQLIKKMA